MNLSASDLSFAYLLDTCLNCANFYNTNMSNANLRNAYMATANLNGVYWDNTICPDGAKSDDSRNTCENNL